MSTITNTEKVREITASYRTAINSLNKIFDHAIEAFKPQMDALGLDVKDYTELRDSLHILAHGTIVLLEKGDFENVDREEILEICAELRAEATVLRKVCSFLRVSAKGVVGWLKNKFAAKEQRLEQKAARAEYFKNNR